MPSPISKCLLLLQSLLIIPASSAHAGIYTFNSASGETSGSATKLPTTKTYASGPLNLLPGQPTNFWSYGAVVDGTHTSIMQFGWANSPDSFYFKATGGGYGNAAPNNGSFDFSSSFTLSAAVTFTFNAFGSANDAQNHATITIDGATYTTTPFPSGYPGRIITLNPGVHTVNASILFTTAPTGRNAYVSFGAYAVPEGRAATTLGTAALAFACCLFFRRHGRLASASVNS